MKKFFEGLIKSKVKPAATIPIDRLCSIHTKQQAKAVQKCATCNSTQCYICTESHVAKHCDILLSAFINPPRPQYKSPKNLVKLEQFNSGIMAELNLENLKCLCGKCIDSQSAMCAACGLASCSDSCHREWQKLGYCTFHLNFSGELKNRNLRSISMKNIEYFYKQNSGPGLKINKTSNRYISCYTASNPKTVNLQRGYRNYGSPNEEVLQNMTILNKNLDFYLNQERMCLCSCSQCQLKGLHTSGNCDLVCETNKGQAIKDLLLHNQYKQMCECKCVHCTSGIIKRQGHLCIECAFQCHESFERRQQH